MTTIIKPTGGLEAVVAASSAICYLDGERGVLAYCGHDIHDLARYRDLRGSVPSSLVPDDYRLEPSWAIYSRSWLLAVRSRSRSYA